MAVVRLNLTEEMEEALGVLRKRKFKFLEKPEILKTIFSEYYADYLSKNEDKLVNLAEDGDFWATKEEEKRIRKSYEEAQKSNSPGVVVTNEKELQEYLSKI